MAPLVRIALVFAALTLGSASLAVHTASPSHVAAAPTGHLVARTGDAADRLRNQQQVVAPPPPPPSTVPANDPALQAIARTNAERAAAGLGPLTVHADLMEAALAHSRDQASMGRMTHTGSDGSNAGTRITRAGYAWRTWAENVAYGYPTPAAVVDGWMGSPGHRANLLNGGLVHIGVAAVAGSDGRLYWTMVLAA